MKLKHFDEFDISARKKWKALEQDIEKYRNLFYNLRKENDKVISESARLRQESKSKIQELQSLHSEELSLMESKLISLQTSLDAVSDTEYSRNLSRENNELQLRVVDMTSELQEVRAERESIRVEFEQQERIHKRIMLDEVANGKQICADRDALKSRVNTLEGEVRDLSASNERLSEESQRESKECAKLKIRLDEAVHRFSMEANEMKMAFLNEKNELANNLDDLKRKIAELKRFARRLIVVPFEILMILTET